MKIIISDKQAEPFKHDEDVYYLAVPPYSYYKFNNPMIPEIENKLARTLFIEVRD